MVAFGHKKCRFGEPAGHYACAMGKEKPGCMGRVVCTQISRTLSITLVCCISCTGNVFGLVEIEKPSEMAGLFLRTKVNQHQATSSLSTPSTRLLRSLSADSTIACEVLSL